MGFDKSNPYSGIFSIAKGREELDTQKKSGHLHDRILE
jgi:hypothetical protein